MHFRPSVVSVFNTADRVQLNTVGERLWGGGDPGGRCRRSYVADVAFFGTKYFWPGLGLKVVFVLGGKDRHHLPHSHQPKQNQPQAFAQLHDILTA